MAQALTSGVFSEGAVTQKFEAEQGLIAALHASAPAPELGEKADLFGWLVGSWEVDLISHRPDPILPKYIECEWHFGWVLGGWAIQDVWIAPKRALRNKSDSAGEWGVVRPFLTRTTDDGIVLEGVFDDERPLRDLLRNH